MTNNIPYHELLDQIKELNRFMLTWKSCTSIDAVLQNVKVQDGQAPSSTKDLMVDSFVTSFSSERKVVQSIKKIGESSETPEVQLQNQHLMASVKRVQITLKSMFFECDQTFKSKNKFVVQDIEHLIVQSEIILQTHFKEKFTRLQDEEEQNECITLKLINDVTSVDIYDKVYCYILNVRMFAVILANVFWNQIKILIRLRVNYDRDTFNFEEYRQTGMSDNRLIKHTLFMSSQKGCKNLMAEFFKFQKQHMAHLNDIFIELNTSNKIIHNFNLLAMHAPNLWITDKSVDIEPLLLVYFQKMALSKQSKDTLSKVSKQFWKDFKHDYRSFTDNLARILKTIQNLFQGQGLLMMSSQAIAQPGCASIDLQINQSFMQFMIMITCDTLIEEHTKFCFTLVRKKNYAEQEHVDKFKQELQRFNHFSAVLAHSDYEHCRFPAIRALRECQRNTRRLCELCDRKIEQALDKQWQSSSHSFQTQISNYQSYERGGRGGLHLPTYNRHENSQRGGQHHRGGSYRGDRGGFRGGRGGHSERQDTSGHYGPGASAQMQSGRGRGFHQQRHGYN